MKVSCKFFSGNGCLALALSTIIPGCLRPDSQGSAAAASHAQALVGASLAGLPASPSWSSSGPIIVPISDPAHELVAVKDPTVVFYNGRWHVYASSVSRGGVYNMVYLSFDDWKNASKAPLYYMDQTPGFKTYVAAPQLFYFAPEKKWYLIYQSGPPMFSTADDPSDPKKWTQPAPFFGSTPKVVSDNGGWLDFWVICEADFCHMFFSNDHGRWYKSKTPVSKFPYGFGDPVVVMEDSEAGRLFEACNVYKIKGTNRFLALIEAFDQSSNMRRYFRSWVSESLEGPWVQLHDSGASPFAGLQNVSFQGSAWTTDISHGEMIRAGYDERMEIDANQLRYLYQGFAVGANTQDYNGIPWSLGLLTQK